MNYTEYDLDKLISELNNVQQMSEEEACKEYNAESKDTLIAYLKEDIDEMRRKIQEKENGYKALQYSHELEEDFTAICLQQGLSRYA